MIADIMTGSKDFRHQVEMLHPPLREMVGKALAFDNTTLNAERQSHETIYDQLLALFIAVNVAAVMLSAWLGVIVGALMIGKAPPFLGVSLNFLGSLPLCIAFIGISLLLSVLLDESGKSVGAILGIIIFQYILLIVSNIAKWGGTLKYFSLFTYWDSMELGLDHIVDPVDMMVPTLLGIILIAVSFLMFNRKEIPA